MIEFHGRTFHYPTADGMKSIGVTRGLGDVYIVAWETKTGSRRRVKTNRLPPGNDPDWLQNCLERFAACNKLDVDFCPVAQDPCGTCIHGKQKRCDAPF